MDSADRDTEQHPGLYTCSGKLNILFNANFASTVLAAVITVIAKF